MKYISNSMFRLSISLRWYGVVCKYLNRNGVKQHALMVCDLRLNSSILTYFRREEHRFASQIYVHVSTPRWSMSIFLFKSDGGTPQNMRFNAFVILVCSIYGENNIWHVKSWRFTLAVEVSQTALYHAGSFFQLRLSRLIYAISARSDSPGIS